MLAHLDLLPQREIGRHVQRAPPYDGHRVELHPMSPLGLTTTGRAPFLYVVEPPYMMASTRAFLTYPRLSSPFRNGGSPAAATSAIPPGSSSPPLTDTVLKQRRHYQPSQPHPDPPLTAGGVRRRLEPGGRGGRLLGQWSCVAGSARPAHRPGGRVPGSSRRAGRASPLPAAGAGPSVRPRAPRSFG